MIVDFLWFLSFRAPQFKNGAHYRNKCSPQINNFGAINEPLCVLLHIKGLGKGKNIKYDIWQTIGTNLNRNIHNTFLPCNKKGNFSQKSKSNFWLTKRVQHKNFSYPFRVCFQRPSKKLSNPHLVVQEK